MDQQHALLSLRQQYSQYAQQILRDLGMEDLEQPIRGQLLGSIEHYLAEIMTNTILENLDEETATGISEMMDEDKDQDEILLYYILSVPNLDKKIEARFTDAYDQLVADARKLTHDLIKTTRPTKGAEDIDGASNNAPDPASTL